MKNIQCFNAFSLGDPGTQFKQTLIKAEGITRSGETTEGKKEREKKGKRRGEEFI